MKRKYLLIIGLLLVVVIGGFNKVPELDVQLIEHTANAGEVTSSVLVGQTFKAERDDLSAVGIKFATYSGRDNSNEVAFHLRESTSSEDDLRTVVVHPDELGDNQFYRFSFEAVPDSGGKTYFFFVDSKEGEPGNAITIDIDGRDPYPLGSAYLMRNIDGVADKGLLEKSGKPTVDLSFETYYDVPFAVASWNSAKAGVRHFIVTWEESRSTYILWLKAAVPAALILLLAWWLVLRAGSNVDTKLVSKILFALLALAVIVRVMYAVSLPATNDEGNYLYDARTLYEGHLAGGDGYVKAFLVVAWVGLWQLLGGASLLVGRLASVSVSALTLLPIYVIGKEMGSHVDGASGKKVGLVSAALWALLGVTTVFGIYVHTQPLAIFFGVSGVALLWRTLSASGLKLFGRVMHVNVALVLSGVLLGMGVVSRKSVLAYGLAVLALILIENYNWKNRIKILLLVGLGFLIVIGIFLTGSYIAYGEIGVIEALGINSAEDGKLPADPDELEQVRVYSIRGMTPFFRESLPLILLSMVGLGVLLQNLLGGWKNNLLLRLLSWTPSWLVFWWAWSFFSEYEGSGLMLFGMEILWQVMAVILVGVSLWWVFARGSDEVSSKSRSMAAVAVAPLWLGGLVVLYLNWIKFHANYIGEFLAPLVVLSGVGLVLMFQDIKSKSLPSLSLSTKRLVLVADGLLLSLIIGWAMFSSGFITFVHEHTGTFQQDAAYEAAEWARNNIPQDEVIFTGAGLIPFLSGHHTALDIAHPRWYAYQWIRENKPRINTFLPPAEEMLQAYREANWFLLERQTGFSFLMEYSEVEAGLETDWESVKGISNGSNTLTFYRRVR